MLPFQKLKAIFSLDCKAFPEKKIMNTWGCTKPGYLFHALTQHGLQTHISMNHQKHSRFDPAKGEFQRFSVVYEQRKMVLESTPCTKK